MSQDHGDPDQKVSEMRRNVSTKFGSQAEISLVTRCCVNCPRTGGPNRFTGFKWPQGERAKNQCLCAPHGLDRPNCSHVSEHKSGKSKWGLSNGGLRPLSSNLRTIVYNCALLWLFLGPLSKGNFRRKMTTIVGNRGQLWTSTLSPHLESPHLDYSADVVSILWSGCTEKGG